MSALRKEEPPSTADIAGRQRANGPRQDAALDQTDVGVADRRPPRPVAAGNTAVYDTETTEAADNVADTDDIYDGEIVSSSVDSTPQSGASSGPANQRRPDPRSESREARPASQTPPPPSRATASSAAQTSAGQDDSQLVGPLFAGDELGNFRARWDQVQTSFVDEPRRAVEQADTLVATVVQRIAEQFAEERAKLEQQWDRGDDVSTEELRQSLKRYRAFFDRLLSF
jgi:hypothetical protein